MRRLGIIVVFGLPAVVIIMATALVVIRHNRVKGEVMIDENQIDSGPAIEELGITVVFDNNPYKQGLGTAWGFSCLVTGAEKTILFDTGGDGAMLLGNMEKLGIEPNSIDAVVLSHKHGDHTGGLKSFLSRNSSVTVYMPESFPAGIKKDVKKSGAKIVEVTKPMRIFENVYSTGQMGTLIKEQGLIIRTGKGLVVITGCAHPGIVKMVRVSKELLGDDILFVMGGFHLEWTTRGKIEKVISEFKQMGVKYAGPTHCSGEKARELFEEHYGDKYIKLGAGRTVTLEDLQ